MFEPLLARLTWFMQYESLSLGEFRVPDGSPQGRPPEVMRRCSNPVGHRPAPDGWGTRDRGCSRRPPGQAHNHGFVAMTSSVSPGQSQKRPSGERSDKRPRRSTSKSARRALNNRGAAHDIEKQFATTVSMSLIRSCLPEA